MKTILIFTLMLSFYLSAQAEDKAEENLATDKQKFSYAVGAQLAQEMAQQAIQLDVADFVQAVEDVLNGAPLRLSPQQMQQAILRYQQQAAKEQEQAGQANKLAGEKFLAENKMREGMIETDSGLQYRVIRQGKGEKPVSDDEVVVHYRGTLINGDEFDSSYARGEPVTLPVSGVIPGWQEILPMMPAGSRWQVYVPSHLAYGERGAGADIGPNAALIFDIELLSVK